MMVNSITGMEKAKITLNLSYKIFSKSSLCIMYQMDDFACYLLMSYSITPIYLSCFTGSDQLSDMHRILQ